jgi:hypothetical protein
MTAEEKLIIISELLTRLSLFSVRSLWNAVRWSLRTHSNSVRIIFLHVNIDSHRNGVKILVLQMTNLNLRDKNSNLYVIEWKYIYKTVRGESNIYLSKLLKFFRSLSLNLCI